MNGGIHIVWLSFARQWPDAMRTQSTLGKIASGANEAWLGNAILLLRLVMGVLFFSAGWSKVTTDWSAEWFLREASGPFALWFQSLAGNWVVDVLNAWGLLLLGVALILGVLVRPASLAGALLMTLYYVAAFTENTAHGYVDEHIVYIAILLLFAAGGVGHAFGINAIVLGNLHKPNRVLRWLFH